MVCLMWTPTLLWCEPPTLHKGWIRPCTVIFTMPSGGGVMSDTFLLWLICIVCIFVCDRYPFHTTGSITHGNQRLVKRPCPWITVWRLYVTLRVSGEPSITLRVLRKFCKVSNFHLWFQYHEHDQTISRMCVWISYYGNRRCGPWCT